VNQKTVTLIAKVSAVENMESRFTNLYGLIVSLSAMASRLTPIPTFRLAAIHDARQSNFANGSRSLATASRGISWCAADDARYACAWFQLLKDAERMPSACTHQYRRSITTWGWNGRHDFGRERNW